MIVLKKCLDLGIAAVKDGAYVGDIGHAIQTYAEQMGYSVVREFGAWNRKTFHEDPQIYHYGNPASGHKLTKGMVFTIEPMINEKDYRCEILSDGWTAVTRDRKLSAQFEHTIAIRNDGSIEILTNHKPDDQSSLSTTSLISGNFSLSIGIIPLKRVILLDGQPEHPPESLRLTIPSS